MFDDYMYHTEVFPRLEESNNTPPSQDTDRNSNNKSRSEGAGGRQRGRSLLQSVATGTTQHSPILDDAKTVKLPPVAEVPRRRAHSMHPTKSQNEISIDLPTVDYSQNSAQTYPLSTKELQIFHEMKDQWIYDDIFEIDLLSEEFDELDLANNHEYVTFRDSANAYSHSCDELLKQAETVSSLLDDLAQGFLYIQGQTNALESTCNSMVKDQSHVEDLSINVEKNLEVFTKLEKALRILHSPGSDIVTKHRFKELLSDLDLGLDYVYEHSNFKDIDLYQMRYKQCMTRALTLSQNYFTHQIRDLSTSIQSQFTVKNKTINTTTQPALLYAKFENESERLKNVTDQIYSRSDRYEEYFGLYEECLKAYFSARYKLLSPIVHKKFEEFSTDPRNLVQLSRSCLSFYKQLCTDEQVLFEKFFSGGDSYFQDWLLDLCDPLYDTLRQKIIREHNIDDLCELTSMLLSYEIDDQGEYMVQQVEEDNSKGREINFGFIFRPVLHDVQSRLVFRVQSSIQTDIVQYVPKPEDLSEIGGSRKHRKKIGKEASTANGIDDTLEGNTSAANEDTNGDHGHDDGDYYGSRFDTESLFKGWYPPMRKAITLLSQIYQLVKSTVFDDLAHRIVHECMGSLQKAQSLALSRLGVIDSHLFFIKHLLTLRTQIMGFDIDYVPTEILVDFSGLQEVFNKARQEGVSFTGSSLLNLAKASVPKVVNNMYDAKEELYAKLKNSIHEFTEASVQSIVKSIMDKPDPKTAVEKTRQLRQDATTEFPRIRNVIETYIEDERTIDILIDSIQDLVIQTYESYQQNILSMVNSPVEVDGMMEVDGLISWLGDIVGKLHKTTSASENVSIYQGDNSSTRSLSTNYKE